MAQKKKKESSEKDDFLKIARKRFSLAEDAESEIRKLALEDLRFRAGEQWPDDVRQSRDLDRRPCLTINRIPQFIRQITNDQRQNRPSIKVSPVDNNADVETAKVFQGIIRHIEYNSNADVAIDTAFEGAAIKGIGYFRVVTDYVTPESFEQEIFIKRVKNSFSVYLDPGYQEPDGSDANWGFIFEDLTKEDYKNQFPDSEMASMEDWRSIGDNAPGWASEETVRVAEYFYKEFQTKTLYLLSDKSVVEEDALELAAASGLEIVSKKTTQVPIIKWCKINAVEKLEETEWAGRWIPIIPVLGDELDVDGKRILEGIVRHAKDPQRMYNYWATSETEQIALAPKAPFIGVEGQFEGHENQWKQANIKNYAYLEYKPKTLAGGQAAPPPQRNVYEPAVAAITQARMQSSEDLKATTGIYDAALGNRANETSGVAIQRRANQAQTANFHYVDNLSRSLRHLGRILVDLIPKVYDTERAIRIVGEDDSQEIVFINQIFERNGKPVQYNLSAGKYDVTISNGPSYATKRQEALASMLDLTKAYPQVAQVAGDLMIKNMDWPGATEIAERLKKTMPPEIVADEKEQNQQIPPQLAQQMQQMNQMIEQLTQQNNQMQDAMKTKQMELDSKERIEMAKLETQARIELAKLDAQDARLLLETQIDQLNRQQEQMGMIQQMELENEAADFAAQEDVSGAENFNPTGGQSPGNYME